MPKYEPVNHNVKFDLFAIKYGVNADDLRIENGKLIDVKSGSAVLLIEGPFKFVHRRKYRKISYDLYREIQYREQLKEAEPH